MDGKSHTIPFTEFLISPPLALTDENHSSKSFWGWLSTWVNMPQWVGSGEVFSLIPWFQIAHAQTRSSQSRQSSVSQKDEWRSVAKTHVHRYIWSFLLRELGFVEKSDWCPPNFIFLFFSINNCKLFITNSSCSIFAWNHKNKNTKSHHRHVSHYKVILELYKGCKICRAAPCSLGGNRLY